MKISAFFKLGRISNLPTIWTNVFAGIAIAGILPQPEAILNLLIAMSLFYIGGMYLNDAFDRNWDKKNRPDRPIPAGHFPAPVAFGMGYVMLGAAVALIAMITVTPGYGFKLNALLSALLLAALIIFYNAYHKNIQIAPTVMGMTRGMIYIICSQVAIAAISLPALLSAAALMLYTMGISYAAKMEATPKSTSKTHLILISIAGVLTLPLLLQNAGAAFYMVFLVIWVDRCLGYIKDSPKQDFGKAINGLIAGFCLLDAVFLAGHDRVGLSLIACMLFGVTVLLQHKISGN